MISVVAGRARFWHRWKNRFEESPLPSTLAEMRIAFTKMNGAGNDFVLIDNRSGSIQLDGGQVRFLCDRQRGIGADGLLLLEVNTNGAADWHWQFFNSNGTAAEMCGNGARCFAAFIRSLTRQSNGLTFETAAGVVRAAFDNGLVTVTLPPPNGLQLNQPLALDSAAALQVHSINTGVPHAVIFVDNAAEADVLKRGRAIRQHPRFAPDGTNVNFVEIVRPDLICVRTYERGVEGETLACGTGISAAAMIASRLQNLPPPIDVLARGGDTLTVDFKTAEAGFSDARLTGPVKTAFTGEIDI